MDPDLLRPTPPGCAGDLSRLRLFDARPDVGREDYGPAFGSEDCGPWPPAAARLPWLLPPALAWLTLASLTEFTWETSLLFADLIGLWKARDEMGRPHCGWSWFLLRLTSLRLYDTIRPPDVPTAMVHPSAQNAIAVSCSYLAKVTIWFGVTFEELFWLTSIFFTSLPCVMS